MVLNQLKCFKMIVINIFVFDIITITLKYIFPILVESCCLDVPSQEVIVHMHFKQLSITRQMYKNISDEKDRLGFIMQ